MIDTLPLGRSDQAAVAITGMSAFAAGFEIFVTARFRPGNGGGPRERMRSFRLGLQLSDGSEVVGGPGGRGPDPAAHKSRL